MGDTQKFRCVLNHTENSGLMESAAAVIIFERSEQKSKLRFTSMLGDGDTTTITKVNDAKPYGAGVVVKKKGMHRTCSKALLQVP